MRIEEFRAKLRWRLAKLRRDPVVVKTIASVEDIFANRYYLRDAKCSADDLRHLLDLVIEAVQQPRRFRQIDCLKTLKRIIQNWPSHKALPRQITDRLFHIYTHYIFSKNEEVQWAVSVMLKDRPLRDEQVEWLIERYQDSGHFLNRLLRYPKRHSAIAAWAQRTLRDADALPDRRSELLGLLINGSIPNEASKESPNVVAWAVYYSKSPDATKAELLKQISSTDNMWDVTDIAERCGYPSVIEHLLSKTEQWPAERLARAIREFR